MNACISRLLIERARDADRRLVAGQRPEVVPVRMHRLRRIAFVTDRGRHQAIERFAIALLVRRGALRQAQLVHVRNRFRRRRPQLPQQLRVAGVAIHAVDEEQELAGAVVLRHRIRAASIDATRHLAVGELIAARTSCRNSFASFSWPRRSSISEVIAPSRIHERSYALRSRLNRRTVAIDQHVRERGAQRVGESLVLRRHSQLDAIQLFAPRRRDGFRAWRSAAGC